MDNEKEFLEENLPVIQDESVPLTKQGMAQEWGLDIEQQTLLMEKAVKYADRMLMARNTLIRKFSYAEDWSVFGSGEQAKACISAAGILRIVDKANFPIRYHAVSSRKEIIKDKDGSDIGYRYVFEGYATLQARTVHALGQYSTREAFLGKAGGEWRDPMEINESHIRQAAHTYFKGNAAKDLLGMKAIPVAEYELLTAIAGQDYKKSTNVKHNTGGQGGISDKDRDGQNELKENLMELAELCLVVRHEKGEDGKDAHTITDPSEELVKYIEQNNADPRETYSKSSLKALTTWTNSSGKLIKGHAEFSRVKEKQSSVLLRKIKELREKDGV